MHPCFYRPPGEVPEGKLTLPERETHHARHVLRLREGDQAWILDGQGSRWLAQVAHADRHTLEWEILERQSEPPAPWTITLLQAVTKAKSMDLVVQKATELGVHRIIPLLTARTVVRPDPDRHMPDKWTWVAIDAMKQCHAAWLPQIEAPVAFHEYLQQRKAAELELVALPRQARHPGEIFRQFRQQQQRAPHEVAVWIGPEGGFTVEEEKALGSASAQAISLGPRVLRAETAAVCALFLVNYELSRPAAA